MQTPLKKLLKDIENCREEMIQTASRSCTMNQEVIDISQKLDELINKYHSLSKK